MKNPSNDRFFLRLLKQGLLTVTRQGVVKNTVTGRVIGTGLSSGYYRVGMHYSYVNGKQIIKSIPVHRLMWLAFKGPIPRNLEVNHRDGVKTNNRMRNFELVTGSQNMIHAWETGLNTGARGKRWTQKRL